MSALRRYLLSAVLFLGVVAGAAAQTTGGIVGRVTDEGGGACPASPSRRPARLSRARARR